MRIAPRGAWDGDATLRRSVLDQMASHLAAGQLGPVLAREATLQLYDNAGVATTAAVLHLPEAVLRLGYTLWSGFHDFGSERQTIEEAREIYRAIAPGADLSSFWDEFAAWVLADPEVGLVAVLAQPLATLAQEDADALILGMPLSRRREDKDPSGYLAARAAIARDEVDALARLADARLAATRGVADEKVLLDALRERFRALAA